MNGQQFYRNVIQVEILSNEPWGDEIEDLNLVNNATMDGGSSGAVTRIVISGGDGDPVDGGFAPDEAGAKQAVADWEDANRAKPHSCPEGPGCPACAVERP
jgi:hypothetical protein